MPAFQRTTSKLSHIDRKDHVWFVLDNGKWKCATCGAVTTDPPSYPTKPGWEPDRYERLTDEERSLLPIVRL